MLITPENVTELAPNEVFTYGSNRGGRHGKGAARTALKWGAVYGQYGFNGQTYGICTKDKHLNVLSLREIGIEVDRFARFAASRPELIFLVTAVGTGLARLRVKDIAPLFAESARLPNVSLPASFWEVLNA